MTTICIHQIDKTCRANFLSIRRHVYHTYAYRCGRQFRSTLMCITFLTGCIKHLSCAIIHELIFITVSLAQKAKSPRNDGDVYFRMILNWFRNLSEMRTRRLVGGNGRRSGINRSTNFKIGTQVKVFRFLCQILAIGIRNALLFLSHGIHLWL